MLMKCSDNAIAMVHCAFESRRAHVAAAETIQPCPSDNGEREMNFYSEALTPRIGTQIRVSAAELLQGGLSAQIRELLEQRGVLLFRELGLTDEQQVAFAKTV